MVKPKTKKEYKRSFTVVWHSLMTPKEKSSSENSGRYLSWTPASAAKKAGGRILKEYNDSHKTKKQQIEVVVRETTNTSNKKEMGYHVKRVKLDKPIKLDNYTIKYETKVKSSDKALKQMGTPKKSESGSTQKQLVKAMKDLKI